MTTQHTLGPWEICQKWPEESKKIQPQGCEIGLAIVYGDTEEEATANATLIAAAPELLAALDQLSEKTRRANDIQHRGGEILPEDWSELYDLTNEAQAAIAKATE